MQHRIPHIEEGDPHKGHKNTLSLPPVPPVHAGEAGHPEASQFIWVDHLRCKKFNRIDLFFQKPILCTFVLSKYIDKIGLFMADHIFLFEKLRM